MVTTGAFAASDAGTFGFGKSGPSRITVQSEEE